ncbi:MAG: PQQ-binding-like beta-propeller repeat protein [Chitinivibrionales bacterium]|nr:PQQ-binding-like beta-propeller repeat protein [Chitinivibrionales bacterium]
MRPVVSASKLWKKELTNIGHIPVPARNNAVAAERSGHVYALQDLRCLQINGMTGERIRTYRVPLKEEELAAFARELEPKDEHIQPLSSKYGTVKPLEWDYLGVTDELIVGNVGRVNPSNRGWRLHAFDEYPVVFALDKKDGSVRWLYRAEESVGPRKDVKTKHSALKCLDAQSGRIVWENMELPIGYHDLWSRDGVILVTPYPMLASERYMWAGGRAKHTGNPTHTGVAYDAKTGNEIWRLPEGTIVRTPVLNPNGRVYIPSNPGAIYPAPNEWSRTVFDVQSGKPVTTTDPLSGKEVPLEVIFPVGCGTYAGSANLLMCRSGSIGFIDVSHNPRKFHQYPDVRPACYHGMIVAGGIILSAEGSSSCSCGYNYKTTLAMAPVDRHNDWGLVYAAREDYKKTKHRNPAVPPSNLVRVEGGGVQSLDLYFGAEGAHTDKRGRQWRELSAKGTLKSLPVSARGGTVVRTNPDVQTISDSEDPARAATALTGNVSVSLDLGDGDAAVYRITAYACPIGQAADIRETAVKANGNTVAQLTGLEPYVERSAEAILNCSGTDTVGINLSGIINGISIEAVDTKSRE